MCISPIVIPNPYKGYKGKYAFMHDCVSSRIHVPCGYCSECVHIKQLGIVQRALVESQFGYPFFCTLTYNNESLPVITTSSGYSIKYADVSDVSNMVKRLRNENAFGRPFRYLAVSEFGTKGRPHFHILFFVQKYEEDNSYTPINLESKLFSVVLNHWSRNVGSKRVPIYKPLCTYTRKVICGQLKSNYDLHFVSPSSVDGTVSDVPFYVTKYMLKPSPRARKLQQALKLNLSLEEYNDIWRLVRPRWFSSLNFGFGVYGLQPKKLSRLERLSLLEDLPSFKYVRSSIERSLITDFPKFYNPDNGRSMPLSRYYKSFGNLYKEEDAIAFHYKNPKWREDNVSFDDKPLSLRLLSEEKHNRDLDIIDSHSFNFDLLD